MLSLSSSATAVMPKMLPPRGENSSAHPDVGVASQPRVWMRPPTRTRSLSCPFRYNVVPIGRNKAYERDEGVSEADVSTSLYSRQ